MDDFENAYSENIFGSPESRSGPGSSLAQTAHLRAVLPSLLRDFQVTSILDAPCGDFNWMSHVDLSVVSYTGVDIVDSVIRANNNRENTNTTFLKLDITTDALPRAEMILCRDCLVHMTLDDGVKAIENFKRSGARYLLATTFTDCEVNTPELILGRWRPLNMTREPFRFAPPKVLVNEQCTEVNLGMAFPDKCLGLWELVRLKQ